MSQPPQKKVPKRIVPTFVGVSDKPVQNRAAVLPLPIGHDERPSVLFTEFMRSLDDPNTEEYFNKRATELGYGEVKIKKKSKLANAIVAEVAPAGPIAIAVASPSDAERLRFSSSLDAFVLKYADLKKHDRKTLHRYLEEKFKDHKYFDEVTQRFKSLDATGKVGNVATGKVECPVCKKMVSKGYLTRHLRSAHGAPTKHHSLVAEKRSDEA